MLTHCKMHQHKCGLRHKNHQCGLGLCSEEGETDDTTQQKKKRSEVQTNKSELVVSDKKICKKCGRPIKGHPLPKGSLCNMEPLPQNIEIQIERRSLQLFKDRERKKLDEALAKDRERKKSEESMVKSKARSKLVRKHKKKKKEYIGWTALEEKNSVQKHNLPNMIETCIDCGAKIQSLL